MKKSIITLYSAPLDIYSHIVRIILAEKGVSAEVESIDPINPSTDLLEMNPYSTYPTLVDRDLILYETPIISEYLDERFPHPPLLPVYPIARAKSRLMIHRIDNDWLKLVPKIQHGTQEEKTKARKTLLDHLVTLAPVFAEMPYFLSEEFSMIDCCLAPLLWRLPHLNINLPAQAKAVTEYAKRIFERISFQTSLSELERELR